MVIKIIGGLVIITASSLVGWLRASEYAERPRQLRDLTGKLQILENELSFMSSPLPEAFRKVAQTGGITAKIFSSAAELLEKSAGLSASAAWETAVRKIRNETAFTDEDLGIIISFGHMLGSSDLEGQIRNIRLTQNRLEMQEKKAEESRRKNESMVKNLGFLGGLALVIFIL